MVSSHKGGALAWMLGRISSVKGLSSGKVTIPGGILKTCRCGAQGHGLMVAVPGQQLDL